MRKCNCNFPRTDSLAEFFEKTALGEYGMPAKAYSGDVNLFKNDKEMLEFYKRHLNLQGNFDKHFYSSIPYILEEECRVGTAILKYMKSKNDTQYLYVLGAAEGTLARTVGEMGHGKILTLSCSPTKANQKSFYRLGIPKYSYFILSPYNTITNNYIKKILPNYSGFDILIEDTTFQMYSSDRRSQIKYAKEKLKSDGIMGFIEKFSNTDLREFNKREFIKDNYFKKSFFSQVDINKKRQTVLGDMHNNLVTLEEFTKILSEFFNYAIVNWNSGNFYTIYSSNNKNNLLDFLSEMTESLTPKEFVHHQLPVILFGLTKNEIKYRRIKEEKL